MRRGAKPRKAEPKRKARPAARRESPKKVPRRPTLGERLREAIEQQAATARLLRLLSSSPQDLASTFEVIVQEAARLCEAQNAQIFRVEDDQMRLVARCGVKSTLEVGAARAVTPQSVSGRVLREARTIHLPDLLAEVEAEYPDISPAIRSQGIRTTLGVPLLRAGRPIGAITIYRTEVRPFGDRQIALVETFADQAVIAIENVRLFTELQARNSELRVALEQQTATGEILGVISSSPTDVQPVLEAVAKSAARLCEAPDVAVFLREADHLRTAAHHGSISSETALPLSPDNSVGYAVLEGRTIHLADIQTEADRFPISVQNARRVGFHAVLNVPLMRDAVAVGAISLRRAEAHLFHEQQVALLETFADQAVIAIENVRLFTELQARNSDLTESLEQQTATSEILRVISSSPTDMRPVFETIARNAVRLCDGLSGVVATFDGEVIHSATPYNYSAKALAAVSRMYPMRPIRGQLMGRAILEGTVVQVADVLADPEYIPDLALAAGWRGATAVPMLREGQPIGAILVTRAEVGYFTERQIELLKTFADQAVIAIENVRLFTELQARTAELTRSVGELQALGEVSRAVGSSLDLETVLATIVGRAVQLSQSDQGLVYEFDEADGTFHQRAAHGISEVHVQAVRAAPIRLGEGAMGRAGVTRQPAQIADIEAEQELVAPQVRGFIAREGLRSLLALPLIREGRLLGGIVILRRQAGDFSPDVVALLQTFATQSVLAIHNARLFAEIERQKQYSEALVETSPVAIASLDLEGKVVGWNPGAERLFGHTQAEAIGRPLDELISTPEIRDEVRAGIQQGFQGERVRRITRRARKDGTLVDVEISAMPVVVDGRQVGFIGIYHDITELLQARREAEAANEAKSAFLATMSHEIRTPMNAVIGMSGLLLNTALDDEQRDYAEVIRGSGDALLTVINDILDFSKIEAGKLELETQPFDLRECVEGALDLVATRAAEKRLDLAYLMGEGVPPAIAGDMTRLRQVLLNLLSNAVKFTERGEVVVSVGGRRPAETSGLHELIFSVRDTGIGIPPDRIDRLFQSFSQVDASTTRRYGGTGLGLAISKRLTELMGGQIGVTSEVGVGSEFRFTIRAPAAEVPASTRRDLSGVQPTLTGKRVLVVDDNATNRRILAAHLEAWGMLARATPSPVEALSWVQAGEGFDIAVLDMHMPEMDGVTLAHALREHPAGAALPLILFTSLGRREAAAAAAGTDIFAAYLNKPIKPSLLFDAMVSALPDQPVHVRERSGVVRGELDPGMASRHPLRILVAEDNAVNQKLALRLLAQMGYRADLAGNGLEAIDAVARQAYDVVLMDVQMPELDGFEASREINRRWPGEGPPGRPRIVAMTANAMQGDRELCLAAGMDDYVSKPIRVEELAAALERCRPRPEVEHRGAPAGGTPEAPVAERVSYETRRLPSDPSSGREGDSAESAAAGAGAAEDGPAPSAIDRTAFDRLAASVGGPFAAELIDAFAQDGGKLVATLRTSLVAADVDAFRRAAHSLKSNGESLGATRLAALARELENLARAGSLEGAGERLAPLAREYESAVHALGELRRALA